MPERLDRLRSAHAFREFHHKALWEEEKHFTWLNSIILSVQVLLLTSDKVDERSKAPLMIVVSVVGVVLSLIAYGVLRRESRNFHDTLATFNDAHFAVFGGYRRDPGKAANKPTLSLLWTVVKFKANIRDSFQFVCLLFCLAFATILVVFLVAPHHAVLRGVLL